MFGQFEISSIGFLAQQLQSPIGGIQKAADQLGIKPSFLNGVAYFDSQAVEQIRGLILAEMRLHQSPILDQRSGIQ